MINVDAENRGRYLLQSTAVEGLQKTWETPVSVGDQRTIGLIELYECYQLTHNYLLCLFRQCYWLECLTGWYPKGFGFGLYRHSLLRHPYL
jgi:hypothetical protein